MIYHVIYDEERVEFEVTRKRVRNINLRVKSDGSIYVSAGRHVRMSTIEAFVIENMNFIRRARASWKQRAEAQEPPLEYVDGEVLTILGKNVTLRVIEENTLGKNIFKKPYVAYDGGDMLYLHITPDMAQRGRGKIMDAFWKDLGSQVFKHWAHVIHKRFVQQNVKVPNAVEIKHQIMRSRWGSCIPTKGIIKMNRRLLQGPQVFIEYVMIHEYAHFTYANHSAQFYNLVAQFMPNWKQMRDELNQYYRNKRGL